MRDILGFGFDPNLPRCLAFRWFRKHSKSMFETVRSCFAKHPKKKKKLISGPSNPSARKPSTLNPAQIPDLQPKSLGPPRTPGQRSQASCPMFCKPTTWRPHAEFRRTSYSSRSNHKTSSERQTLKAVRDRNGICGRSHRRRRPGRSCGAQGFAGRRQSGSWICLGFSVQASEPLRPLPI